ncbi:DNA polymerase III PolC-type [Stieleria maiorica]|uniref:DNA polymerase III PolC-type n=1 Tax=Stieleria maiorica TaxID=2795974 RepID=A0A5B9MJ07_9BACT|nr:exonuclease domain-containing protein [Stieleria maiorica]QEF99017.1 DNA polymerase III PolC-type [Stieleria maiorica]
MAFLANFTAIDFETANRRRDSACQLAAVVVRDGQIADERMWMIRPDPFFFSPGNIRIHGIKPADVQHEPHFGDAWDEIRDFFGDDCLIAHNAPFDIGVLIGCLQRHHCAIPELRFSCTRLIARQTWPDRRRFGLKPLADWLGVQFKHHDALEDSRACAKVLLAAGIARSAESIEDLEDKLRIVRGKAGEWGVSHAAKKGRPKKSTAKRKTDKGLPKRTLRRGSGLSLPLPANPFDERSYGEPKQGSITREAPPAYGSSTTVSQDPQPSEIDWQRLSIRAEFIQPLRGKQIVIVGQLRVITNDQAIDLTRRGGGVHQADVDESTNCVVIGTSEVDRQKVDQLTDRKELQIISESEFLTMIGL